MFVGLLAPALLGAATTSRVTTSVAGSFNEPQENGCLWVSAFRFRADCSFSAEPKAANEGSMPWRWIGPTGGAVYYPTGSRQRSPEVAIGPPGDERRGPTLSGEFTIDTRGTEVPDDDLVSGRLVVGPSLRKLVTRLGPTQFAPPKVVVESWSRIVHTLPPTAVTSVTSIGTAGRVYEIAPRGFPERLCRRAASTDCFPSGYAHATIDGATAANFWSNPGLVPITRDTSLGANPGAQTTAVITGYACQDNADGDECRTSPLVWGGRLPAGLDNLVLRVETHADGTVAAVTGYWTIEYRLEGGPARLATPDGHHNSWFGGYLRLVEAGFDGEPVGTSPSGVPSSAVP